MKYIDKEEREIVESLENLDVDAIESDKENIEKLKKAAQDYIDKQDKTITLRISSKDIEKIKKIAAKKGLRYQTFIKSVLHEIIEENSA